MIVTARSLSTACFSLLSLTLGFAAESPNLIGNGGFEDGVAGWMYQQWEGKAVPGTVDRDDPAEGAASFKMSTPASPAGRYMAREIAVPDPAKDHVLLIAVKTQAMPAGAGRIRLGIEGRGWFGTETGKPDLLSVGGTHDWKTYGFAVPAEKLSGARKATLFVYHDSPDKGTLGIDGIVFRPGEASEVPARSGVVALQGDTSRPSLSTFALGEPVELRFAASGLAKGERTTLRLTVMDAHGQQVAASEADVVGGDTGDWKGTVAGPCDRLGFYRVQAGLADGTVLAPLGSRAAGFLTYAVVPDPKAREEFGERQTHFGMQGGFGPWGDEVLAYLGARWVLDGTMDWKRREPDNAGQFKASSVQPHNAPAAWKKYSLPTLFMAPSWAVEPETFAYNTGKLTPEGEKAWAAYCREAATAYARLNPDRELRYYQITWEPIQPWGFKGRDEDLVRIYELAYDAIHAADPKAAVAGPCRGVDKNEVERTTALLKLGLGRWLDAYSVHPYFSYEPERDGMAQRLREMRAALREHVGKDLPLLGTEQGLSTHEDPAKDLDHARALIRQNLITLGEGYQFNLAFYIVDYRMAGQSGYGYYYNLVDGVPWGPAKISPRPVAPAYAAQSLLLEGHDAVGTVDGLGETARGYVFQRGGHLVLALWDYGTVPGTRALLPVGAREAVVHDWMGNPANTSAPHGMLDIPLGPEPLYVTGVSPRLWGRDAEKLLTVPQPRIILADAAEASLHVAVAAPAGRAVDGLLVVEADPRLGVARMEHPVKLAAGALSEHVFDLRVPADAATAAYPLRLMLTEAGTVVGYAGATLELVPPVGSEGIAPTGPRALSIVLRNRGASPQSGNVTVRLQRVFRGEDRPDLPMIDLPEGKARVEDVRDATAAMRFELSAGGTGTQTVAFAGATLHPYATYRAQLDIVPDTGRRASAGEAINFAVVPRAAHPLAADGELSDWGGIDGVAVRGREAVIRSAKQYVDDRDLAANVRMAWDDEAVWIAVEVTDDAVFQSDTDTMIWRGDCVQLAVDVAERGTGKPSKSTETTFALSPRGVESFRHLSFDPERIPMGPLGADTVRAAVRRTMDGLVYEIAYPWKSLGLDAPPRAGRAVAMALCINDRDAESQTDPTALGVFDGIYPAKDAARFGCFLLGE